MSAFDTDILSDLAKSVTSIVTRVAAVPPDERFVAIVVAEETVRGQLAAIRRAQAGVGRVTIEQSYAYLEETILAFRDVQFLPYTSVADALVLAWRAAKLKVGIQDLRIAAICVAHGAKLVTRNARDFALVPGLNLEIWK